MDDKRKTFHPVLWDPELKDYQSLEQVWFPGMHTDVGGGYKENHLSDLSLIWMCRKAMEHGLLLYDTDRISLNPDPGGVMHNSRGDWWKKIYRREIRRWSSEREDVPVVHESVLERSEVCDYDPWILEQDFSVESRVEDIPSNNR